MDSRILVEFSLMMAEGSNTSRVCRKAHWGVVMEEEDLEEGAKEVADSVEGDLQNNLGWRLA